MKNYDHVIKNKMLPSGKLISDYEFNPDKKLRKLEHFQVEKVYNWMLSDLK